MRSRLTAIFKYLWACTLCIAMGCAGISQPVTPPAGDAGDVPKQLQSRQIIITLAPAAPERWASLSQGIARDHGLPQVGAFPLTSIGVQCVVFQVPEHRAFYEVMTRLAADERVESVQPNHVFQGLGVLHNDPYAMLQYGVQVVRAHMAHRWATGKGVKIAVVDTGVDTTHPDLHGRIVETANFVDGGEHTFDQDRHGTAVAGVIGARAGNAVGIFGVAPEAEIVAAKACWQRAPEALEAVCSSWTLAKAVDFAVRTGVQILNLSLAGPPDPLLARLITKAVANGTTSVAAALEKGAQAPGFPASLETVIAVVASDPHGRLRGGVEIRRTPLLAAPGVEVLTTLPQQTYDFLSGSSLAAAHVSGIAALLLEIEPQLTPLQMHDLLRASAQPVGGVDGFPHGAIGLVNACAALEKLLGRVPCS